MVSEATPRQSQQRSDALRIAFMHPDLGLGGAERLVVDAAVELVKAGHHVDVFTAYYNPNRCFEETRNGSFGVIVAGGWWPRSLLGRMYALCAYLRCTLAALYLAWSCWRGARIPYDVIIVDQVSAVTPLLQLFTSSCVLFYCHFPDLLLSKPASRLHRIYRKPLNYIEEYTTGSADAVLVNSAFTAGVFADTFQRLEKRGLRPRVLHPAVSVPPVAMLQEAEKCWTTELDTDLVALMRQGPVLLSINRFERKKGIGLALDALAALLRMHEEGGASAGPKPVLVLAGGYDVRLAENVEHLAQLRIQTARLGLSERVAFVPSFTDRQSSLLLMVCHPMVNKLEGTALGIICNKAWQLDDCRPLLAGQDQTDCPLSDSVPVLLFRQRLLLLAACTVVLYTPQHEHFGIVPLEAMVAGRPVIAVSSGGPTESIQDGETGFLCEPTAAAFAAALSHLLQEPGAAKRMGMVARSHVEACFSRKAFGQQLDSYVRELVAGHKGGGGVHKMRGRAAAKKAH